MTDNNELNQQTADEEAVKNTPAAEQTVEVNVETSSEADAEVESADELEQLKEENQALEDKVLRLQAEIANIQRRNTKERQDAAKFRSQALAEALLDVIDNLERALETEVTSEDGIALKTGVEMVYNQFKHAFNNENIEAVNPLNEEFDPNFHQAISTVPGEEGQTTNQVVQVLQKGYRIDNRVIRPAMVIVAQ